MSNLFQLPQEEKNRIRRLHLTEGKDKRITSVLNEGFFAKLFGSKTRKGDMITILQDAQKAKGASSGLRNITKEDIKRFTNFLDKLDRYFVNETKLIELMKKNNLTFLEYDEMVKALVSSDYWEESKKPENFLDFLVTAGKFKEGEKRELDVLLQSELGWNSSLSQLTKDEEAENREKHGECNPDRRESSRINKVDKETYPAEWKWCQDRIDAWVAENPWALELEDEESADAVAGAEEEEGTLENPIRVKFPLVKSWPDGEEGKHYRNSRNEQLYVIKGGKYVQIDKQGKVIKQKPYHM